LQCVAAYDSTLQRVAMKSRLHHKDALIHRCDARILQCVAVRLQRVAASCSELQRVAACCSGRANTRRTNTEEMRQMYEGVSHIHVYIYKEREREI